MPQPTDDILAAMEQLGRERQAMVTLSFNPFDGNHLWMATIGHGTPVGWGSTPEEAVADLRAKLQQGNPGGQDPAA